MISRTNERIPRTKIADIKFKDWKIPFVFRDPQLIQTKKDTAKARSSYGVIAKWSGLPDGPYELIKVLCQ